MKRHTHTIWTTEDENDVLIETVPGKLAWKIVPAVVELERAYELLAALTDALGQVPKGERDEDQD
jgi:hypothetical protein